MQISVLWKLQRTAGGQEHPGTSAVTGAASSAKFFPEIELFKLHSRGWAYCMSH